MLKEVYRQDTSWPMGASCGRTGSDISGTLGGAVILKDRDKTRFMGLTNSYVIPSNKDNAGVIQVSIPSDSDHKYAFDKRENNLKSAQRDVKKEDERAIVTGKPHRDVVKSQLNLSTQELQEVKEFHQDAGHVYASSHTPWNETEITRWAMDWCLFETLPGKTVLSRVEDPTGTTIQADKYASISRKDYVYDVIKRGRSSHWTKGTTSAVRSVIRLNATLPPEIPGPIQTQMRNSKDKVYCYSITAKESDQEFLKPGDSGAFILLNESFRENHGVIIGLGFAGNSASNVSYMIPMDLVIKSLVQETNCEIVQPSYIGEISGRKGKEEE
ncbi:hypothetical protein P154DRAFT_539047 [Amniculicola lignicola CBS 123094]|uniref:Uncharacterized protein n=1 Tax=Amniculicola lignicola CBS 123094 TaxID=1392246 RepID=A0A6A5W7F2_9PLEO|nr:hypothetical protein P154DRAFT_539047 [Amniculicola lignicola CBS 123094]